MVEDEEIVQIEEERPSTPPVRHHKKSMSACDEE